MKVSRLSAPAPPLPLEMEPKEDIQQLKARCPSFNTMQVRRPKFKKTPIPRTPSELWTKNRSSSGKVGSGRSSATLALKNILSQSCLEKTEEIAEARKIIEAKKENEEDYHDDSQTPSSLSSVSSPQVKFETKSLISHIREDLEGSVDSLEEGDDKLLQCITSLRAISSKDDSASKLWSVSDKASGVGRRTPSHIAGVKDLKAFSQQRSRVEKKAAAAAAPGTTHDFVYALAKSGVGEKWNPYELDIVPAERARGQEVYFTISAFSVSQVRWLLQTCGI